MIQNCFTRYEESCCHFDFNGELRSRRRFEPKSDLTFPGRCRLQECDDNFYNSAVR